MVNCLAGFLCLCFSVSYTIPALCEIRGSAFLVVFVILGEKRRPGWKCLAAVSSFNDINFESSWCQCVRKE